MGSIYGAQGTECVITICTQVSVGIITSKVQGINTDCTYVEEENDNSAQKQRKLLLTVVQYIQICVSVIL